MPGNVSPINPKKKKNMGVQIRHANSGTGLVLISTVRYFGNYLLYSTYLTYRTNLGTVGRVDRVFNIKHLTFNCLDTLDR